MPINTPTSSIEGNTETVVELLSNYQIFEAISNVFFKRFRSSGYEKFFDDEEERMIFVKENISQIANKLNNKEKFDGFVNRLLEIYAINGDELGIGIVEKIKSKKFNFLWKGTEVTVQLESKDGNIENGVSTEILLLSEKLKIRVEELLALLLQHDESYFEKLNTKLDSTSSENGKVLGVTSSDIAFVTTL